MDSKNSAGVGAVVIGMPAAGRTTRRQASSAVRVFKHLVRGEAVTAILDPLGRLDGQHAAVPTLGPAICELAGWQRELSDVPGGAGRRSASLRSARWSVGPERLERAAGERAAALVHVRLIVRAIGAAVDEAASEALTRLANPDDATGSRVLDDAYVQISGLKSVMVAVDWQLAEVHAMWARALREETQPTPVDEDQLALDACGPDAEAGSLRNAELAEEFSLASRGLDQLEETFDAVWSVFCTLVDEQGPLRAMGAGREVTA